MLGRVGGHPLVFGGAEHEAEVKAWVERYIDASAQPGESVRARSSTVRTDEGRGRIGDVPEAVRRRYYTDNRSGPGQGFYVDAIVTRPASGERLVNSGSVGA